MSADANPNQPPAPKKTSSILLKILLAFVILIGGFAAYVASRPDHYHIERSTTVDAAPQTVFECVNDFHNWEDWSPWAKRDPEAKNTFEGPAAGKGAVFKWNGNDEVGEGAMTLLESTPPELIKIKLAFERPMQDACDVAFQFQPVGEQTKVTWSMSGDYQNFFHKALCAVMNMEKMIGPDFEKGLASLKKLAEAKS